MLQKVQVPALHIDYLPAAILSPETACGDGAGCRPCRPSPAACTPPPALPVRPFSPRHPTVALLLKQTPSPARAPPSTAGNRESATRVPATPLAARRSPPASRPAHPTPQFACLPRPPLRRAPRLGRPLPPAGSAKVHEPMRSDAAYATRHPVPRPPEAWPFLQPRRHRDGRPPRSLRAQHPPAVRPPPAPDDPPPPGLEPRFVQAHGRPEPVISLVREPGDGVHVRAAPAPLRGPDARPVPRPAHAARLQAFSATAVCTTTRRPARAPPHRCSGRRSPAALRSSRPPRPHMATASGTAASTARQRVR